MVTVVLCLTFTRKDAIQINVLIRMDQNAMPTNNVILHQHINAHIDLDVKTIMYISMIGPPIVRILQSP